MGIKPDWLWIPGNGNAPAASLKAGCGKISGIADIRTVFTARRMDENHRISVLLAEATEWKRLCGLTERGFGVVNEKKNETERLVSGTMT